MHFETSFELSADSAALQPKKLMKVATPRTKQLIKAALKCPFSEQKLPSLN